MKNSCKCCEHFILSFVDYGYSLKHDYYTKAYNNCNKYKGVPVETNTRG